MCHIEKLNALIKSGKVIPTQKSLFGSRGARLADNSAEIKDISALPRGRAGAIFYLINGYELISNGKTVARWVYGPKDHKMSHRAYLRATRWLWLKAQKQTT